MEKKGKLIGLLFISLIVIVWSIFLLWLFFGKNSVIYDTDSTNGFEEDTTTSQNPEEENIINKITGKISSIFNAKNQENSDSSLLAPTSPEDYAARNIAQCQTDGAGIVTYVFSNGNVICIDTNGPEGILLLSQGYSVLTSEEIKDIFICIRSGLNANILPSSISCE